MTKLEKVLYTAKSHVTGGRDGAAKTDDGRLDVKLSSPGTSGTGTNPDRHGGDDRCRYQQQQTGADDVEGPLDPARRLHRRPVPHLPPPCRDRMGVSGRDAENNRRSRSMIRR